jgi:hypothetical protein
MKWAKFEAQLAQLSRGSRDMLRTYHDVDIWHSFPDAAVGVCLEHIMMWTFGLLTTLSSM